MIKKIVIKGAKEHNLKNVSVEIPKDQFVVITGLSGSGKSSLAFDTIYAEGQRRYVESLSAYARQFLDKMKKPNVDLIEGLSPAIAIEQKNTSKNPRSTVATPCPAKTSISTTRAPRPRPSASTRVAPAAWRPRPCSPATSTATCLGLMSTRRWRSQACAHERGTWTTRRPPHPHCTL